MDDTFSAKDRDQDHRFFPFTIRRSTWEPKGAAVCVMLCLTASPPPTVFSVITYRTPVSTSNKTPSITSSKTDLNALAPVPRSKAILAISRTAASENTKSAPVEPDQLSELLDQRILRSDKNPDEIINAEAIQGSNHRQLTDDLRDQTELFQVFMFHLAPQPISIYLVIYSHLIDPETALSEPLSDDFLQPHERPAADKQDIGRVKRNARLHRMLVTAKRWRRGDRAFEQLEQGVLDAESHILEPRSARTELFDLVDVDDSPLGCIQVAVGCLDRSGEQVFNVLADISSFRQGRRITSGTLR
jgi:hypothetical protein